MRAAVKNAEKIYAGQFVSATAPTTDHVVNSARSVFEHAYPNPVEPESRDRNYLNWAKSIVLASIFHQENQQPRRVNEALNGNPDALQIIEELKRLRISPTARAYITEAVNTSNKHAQAAMLIRLASINQSLRENRSLEYSETLAKQCQADLVPIARAMGYGKLAQELDEQSLRILLDHRSMTLPGLDADQTEHAYVETEVQLDELEPRIHRANRYLHTTMSNLLAKAGVQAYLRDENNAIISTIGATNNPQTYADIYIREKNLASTLRKRVRYAAEGKPNQVEDLPDLLSTRIVLRYKKQGNRMIPATMEDVANFIHTQIYAWIAHKNARFNGSQIQKRAGAVGEPLIIAEFEGYIPAEHARHFHPPERFAQLVFPLQLHGPKPNGYTNTHIQLHYNPLVNSVTQTLPHLEIHVTTLTHHLTNEFGPGVGHADYKSGERRFTIPKETILPESRRHSDQLVRLFLHRKRGITEEVHEILVYPRHDGSLPTIEQALTDYGVPPRPGMRYLPGNENNPHTTRTIQLKTRVTPEQHGVHIYERP